MNIEIASVYFGTTDESEEAASVTDHYNEEYVEAEVINEGASGDTEDQDVGASDHPEVIKDEDSETSAHTEVLEDMYPDASAHPEVPKDNKVPISGDRDEGNTQKTPKYVRIMDLNVEYIDKYNKNA